MLGLMASVTDLRGLGFRLPEGEPVRLPKLRDGLAELLRLGVEDTDVSIVNMLPAKLPGVPMLDAIGFEATEDGVYC